MEELPYIPDMDPVKYDSCWSGIVRALIKEQELKESKESNA